MHNKRSVIASFVITELFAVLTVAGAFTLPMLTRIYCDLTDRPERVAVSITVGCYTCLPFVLAALVCLHMLLANINREQTFIVRNVTLLRVMSWLCFVIGLVCLVSGFFYMPFFLVAAAAAFIALIIRVIKNVFASAIKLKDENDMTI